MLAVSFSVTSHSLILTTLVDSVISMSETETSILSELQVASYAETAAISLALYDFLICLDHEIDVIWKRKLNLSTVLYLALRYLGLLVVISTALSYMNMSISNLGCLSMWWISEVGGYILVFFGASHHDHATLCFVKEVLVGAHVLDVLLPHPAGCQNSHLC